MIQFKSNKAAKALRNMQKKDTKGVPRNPSISVILFKPVYVFDSDFNKVKEYKSNAECGVDIKRKSSYVTYLIQSGKQYNGFYYSYGKNMF